MVRSVPARPGMPHPLELRGLLTFMIHRSRSPVSVAQLVASLERQGVRTNGRSSKVISDSLRAEVARGRVVRIGRGLYGAGTMPRSTRQRIEARARRALAIGAEVNRAAFFDEFAEFIDPDLKEAIRAIRWPAA